MNWPMLEKIYLAFSRIFDGLIKFLTGNFNPSSPEVEEDAE